MFNEFYISIKKRPLKRLFHLGNGFRFPQKKANCIDDGGGFWGKIGKVSRHNIINRWELITLDKRFKKSNFMSFCQAFNRFNTRKLFRLGGCGSFFFREKIRAGFLKKLTALRSQ